MPNNPIYNCKIINTASTRAAATTDVDATFVDTQGWDGVVFLGRIASAATTNQMHAAMATATGGSVTELAGTAVRNKTHVRLDVYRPRQRYVRQEFERASVALGDSWAILYNGRDGAVAATDNVGEFHASPTGGTP